MTEEQLQQAVIEMAQTFKWRVAHFRPARTEAGWRTAVSADGAGFPDLVLARERVVFVELKGAKGKMSHLQMEWARTLIDSGAEWYCWAPPEWLDGTIERTLR